MEIVMEFSSEKPTASAVYLVDRGAQGRWYRYYNAETQTWGMTCYKPEEALALAAVPSALPFLPYHAKPVKVRMPTVEMVVEMIRAQPDNVPKSLREAKPVVVKAQPVKPKAEKVKAGKHPDGTIFFRADRNKWVAIWNGKQEAARDSIEACQKFLAKKYGFTDAVVVEIK